MSEHEFKSGSEIATAEMRWGRGKGSPIIMRTVGVKLKVVPYSK